MKIWDKADTVNRKQEKPKAWEFDQAFKPQRDTDVKADAQRKFNPLGFLADKGQGQGGQLPGERKEPEAEDPVQPGVFYTLSDSGSQINSCMLNSPTLLPCIVQNWSVNSAK